MLRLLTLLVTLHLALAPMAQANAAYGGSVGDAFKGGLINSDVAFGLSAADCGAVTRQIGEIRRADQGAAATLILAVAALPAFALAPKALAVLAVNAARACGTTPGCVGTLTAVDVVSTGIAVYDCADTPSVSSCAVAALGALPAGLDAGAKVLLRHSDGVKEATVVYKDGVRHLEVVPNRTVVIDDGKFDYLFGRVTSNPHSTARSQQLQSELEDVGIWDTPSGRQTLTTHFDGGASDPSSVVRTFSETRDGVTQNFTVRESLLAGPGGFVRLETTFETMADGSSRFITTIPYR